MKFLKLGDFAVIAFSLILTILFALTAYSNGNAETIVKIESEGRVWIYPIADERTTQIDGPLGITEIEISDNRVRFLESPCHDEICMLRSWMSSPEEWSACLPNRVLISIEGDNDIEIDTANY